VKYETGTTGSYQTTSLQASVAEGDRATCIGAIVAFFATSSYNAGAKHPDSTDDPYDKVYAHDAGCFIVKMEAEMAAT